MNDTWLCRLIEPLSSRPSLAATKVHDPSQTWRFPVIVRQRRKEGAVGGRGTSTLRGTGIAGGCKGAAEGVGGTAQGAPGSSCRSVRCLSFHFHRCLFA